MTLLSRIESYLRGFNESRPDRLLQIVEIAEGVGRPQSTVRDALWTLKRQGIVKRLKLTKGSRYYGWRLKAVRER